MMSVRFTRGSKLGSNRFQVVQEFKDIQSGLMGSWGPREP